MMSSTTQTRAIMKYINHSKMSTVHDFLFSFQLLYKFTSHCPSPYRVNVSLLKPLEISNNISFPYNFRGDTGGVLVQYGI